jgi:hypothetical protein
MNLPSTELPSINPFRDQLAFEREQEARRMAATEDVFDLRTSLTYKEIFELYENSSYGKHHAGQDLRWKPFHYDPDQMLLDFGDDAHPVKHMKYTHDAIVVPMLLRQIEEEKADQLSPQDIRVLRFAALTHDFGECEYPPLSDKMNLVGDVPLPYKSKHHEDEEQSVRKHIYKELFDYIDPEIIEETENIIMKNNPDDYSTKFFRAAEDIGYLMTGCLVASTALANKKRYIHFEHFQDTDNGVRLFNMGRFVIDRFFPYTQGFEEIRGDYPFVNDVVEIAEGLSFQIETN